jgi:hypothetical protein
MVSQSMRVSTCTEAADVALELTHRVRGPSGWPNQHRLGTLTL